RRGTMLSPSSRENSDGASGGVERVGEAGTAIDRTRSAGRPCVPRVRESLHGEARQSAPAHWYGFVRRGEQTLWVPPGPIPMPEAEGVPVYAPSTAVVVACRPPRRRCGGSRRGRTPRRRRAAWPVGLDSPVPHEAREGLPAYPAPPAVLRLSHQPHGVNFCQPPLRRLSQPGSS